MPNIGEIKKASELGYNISKGHDINYVYAMCSQCSRTRWVRNQDMLSGKGLLCRSCCHTTTGTFRNHIDRVVASGAKRASELGKPHYRDRDPWYYPHLCSVCGKPVWHQRRDMHRVCKSCTYIIRHLPCGESHPSWNGGRYTSGGYIMVQVLPSSPYYPMAHATGYVLEHRLVVAQNLGRCLEDSEVVHHIDGNQKHNSIDNLELLPNNTAHLPYILLQQQVSKLEEKVKLLQWHIRELEQANPDLADGLGHWARVETLQEASVANSLVEDATDEEKVHPHGKS